MEGCVPNSGGVSHVWELYNFLHTTIPGCAFVWYLMCCGHAFVWYFVCCGHAFVSCLMRCPGGRQELWAGNVHSLHCMSLHRDNFMPTLFT